MGAARAVRSIISTSAGSPHRGGMTRRTSGPSLSCLAVTGYRVPWKVGVERLLPWYGGISYGWFGDARWGLRGDGLEPGGGGGWRELIGGACVGHGELEGGQGLWFVGCSRVQ